MWSQSFSELARGARRRSVARQAAVPVLALASLLGGCGSHPAPKPAKAPPVAVTSPPPAPAAQAPTATPGTATTAGVAGSASAAPAPRPPVPPAAASDFARAVGYMRAGNATEAELGFKQIALQYPQFAAPLVNLGLLYRKHNRLEDSEQALKSAVDHEPTSAVAWTELGVTQRMRGEFKAAAGSYEEAIKADPQ